jgi:dCMP deaminase
MEICKVISKRSKDPSTKLGAVIVGPDKEIRSAGYNCFPRGVEDFHPERVKRPLKYAWFEHAERNAIYNAARMGTALSGCVIYTLWIPCPDCARRIIQVGIKEVIVGNATVPDRWVAQFSESSKMLSEAGIIIRKVNETENISENIKQELQKRVEEFSTIK